MGWGAMSPAGKRQRGLQWGLLIAALVLLVALLRGWQMDREREEGAAIAPPLARGEGASVVGFTLQLPEGRVVLARDGGGGWWLVAPVADFASVRMVREMLRNLEQLQVSRLLETSDRQVYGLEDPRSELVLERLTGVPLHLAIGDPVPSAAAFYATWDGLPGVALIAGDLVHRFFMTSLFTWREREMLPPGDPVDSVWVASAGGSCRARRIARERWEFTRPRDREPEEKAIERAVSALWRYPFLEFYDEGDPEQLGLAPPRAEWIYFRGGQVDTLHIGRRLAGGEMVARLAGRPPGRVAGELYDLLAGGLEALESRRFLRGAAENVDRLLVATPAGGMLFARAGATWRQASVPVARLRALAGAARPDTTGWTARDVEDPAFEADLANLFETSGDAHLPEGVRERPPRETDFDLRCDLWGAEGFHQWIRIAVSPGPPRGGRTARGERERDARPGRGGTERDARPESGEADAALGAEIPGLKGVAVGSRFPERPMWVDSPALLRMAGRAGSSRRVFDQHD